MIEIPASLWPATALDLYRIVMAIPSGIRCRVVALTDEMVVWQVLP